MEQLWVTTIDNPCDYFNDFEQWYQFDREKGYNTCELVARIADYSNEMSEIDKTRVINEAVKEIANDNFLGIYRLISNFDTHPE